MTLLFSAWGFLRSFKFCALRQFTEYFMARNNYFQFKQFTIYQDNAAMKVGTDGTLLGAWASVEGCMHILDIGTGTGLIALMIAQRSNATITAIEIEENAALEAKQNVAISPWKDRVNVQHISLQKYSKTSSSTFDLIVSNPPFFTQSFKAANQNRTMARHNDSLPFSDLFSYSTKRLNPQGRLALVLPADAANDCVKLANKNMLFLIRRTDVKPKARKEVNRVLLEFSKHEVEPMVDSLTIYDDKGGYTESYKLQTKDFYLKF